MAGIDPLELGALALGLATDAAGLLRRAARAPREEVATKSTPTDLVTAADRASEELLVHAIRAARPEDGILGEEGTAHPGSSGVRWVLDPLDGTTNFLYDLPAYAVSVAAELHGEVVAAAVVDAARGERFSAVRGHGARLDGRALRVGGGVPLGAALVGTGFGYDAARRARQGAVTAGLLPRIRDLRRVGAASIDLCWVACGRLDAYYEVGLQPWDLAAGALVAAEAGALVTGLDDDAPSGRFTLAAPPALHEELRHELRRLDAGSAWEAGPAS